MLGAKSSTGHITAATQISSPGGHSNPVSISLNKNQGSSSGDDKGKKKLKGGLTLVYAADGEGDNEISMEEMRAVLPRYQKILSRMSSIHKASM